jgi:hypothetical protein
MNPPISSSKLWDLAFIRHNLTHLRNTHHQYKEKLATLEPQIQRLRQTDNVHRATESDPTLYNLETTADLASLKVLLDAQDRIETIAVILHVKIREVEEQLGAFLVTQGLPGSEVEAVVKAEFHMGPFWGLRERMIEMMTELLHAQKEHIRIVAELNSVHSDIRESEERKVVLRALIEEVDVVKTAVLHGEKRVSEWRTWVENALARAVTSIEESSIPHGACLSPQRFSE